MTELAIWCGIHALVFWLIYKWLDSIVNSEGAQDWTNRYHDQGDYWDGEGLDSEHGTIGPDGRPTARHRSYVARTDTRLIERFDDGQWQDSQGG